MSLSIATRAVFVAAGLLSLTATAAHADRNCFFVNQWYGTRAADDNTIYLRVNISDIYKVQVSGGASQLNIPTYHLVSIVRGGNVICTALDLDLKVSDGSIRTGLIATSLTKLTPEEVAAIPKKDRP
jgi:hypothetical protein